MKKLSVLIFIFLFYSNAYCETVLSSEGVYLINGAQVFVLDERYNGNLDLFFKEVKSKGINTVFFRVFHNNKDRSHLNMPLNCESGVYFETKHACTVNNLLKDMVYYAHKNNIKLYAWMATRSLSFLKTEDNMSMSLSAEGGNVSGYGANIFKKEVRDTLLNLFEDLAKYEIDGILFQDDFIIKYTEGSDKYAAALFKKEFQDDFIIKYTEGSDKYAAALFKKETGIEVKKENFFKSIKEYNGRKVFSEYKDEFYVWAEWKSSQLALLFKELKERAKTVNPKIKFAANVYYETPVDEAAALAWYSQKLSTLKSAGADYFAVMGYFEQISSEQKLGRAETASLIGSIAKNAVKVMGNEKAVIMKMQSRSFLGKGMLSYDDYKLVCRQVKLAGNVSYAVVPVFSSDDIYVCPK